jgi:hypothetical protein
MAIVTWPLSSAEARGRVGGLIYNTWRGKSYVKAYAHYQSGKSAKQILTQQTAAAATAAWQALSDDQRAAWDAYALTHTLDHWTGQPKRLTAYNWFLKLQFYQRLIWDFPYPDPPPIHPALILLNPYLFTPDGTISLLWTPQTSAPPYTWAVDIWLQGPHSPAVKPQIKRSTRVNYSWEPTGYFDIEIPSTGTYDVHYRPIHYLGITMPFNHLTTYAEA